LDVYAKGTLGNLLKRLKHAGLKKTDSILDYGCGNGVFIGFLKTKGYTNVIGYDPYVPEFANLSDDVLFDCVVANDVIEHVDDPRSLIKDCVNRLERGGLLYIGTADSEGVDMNNLEPHIMCLHQPFHRIIITQGSLQSLGRETSLQLIRSYRRSYMDTLIPFVNYRFLDEFSKALGHNMDSMFDPAAGKIILQKPILLFFAFFGFFFPSACEPAVVLRKSK
jgi:SAM-dependent methyltransferase